MDGRRTNLTLLPLGSPLTPNSDIYVINEDEDASSSTVYDNRTNSHSHSASSGAGSRSQSRSASSSAVGYGTATSSANNLTNSNQSAGLNVENLTEDQDLMELETLCHEILTASRINQFQYDTMICEFCVQADYVWAGIHELFLYNGR